MLYRLSEHDHGVAFVAFSHDDRLLCSGGVPEDGKILVWDMSNGCIVAIVQHDPVPTTVAIWGGMVRCGTRKPCEHLDDDLLRRARLRAEQALQSLVPCYTLVH